MLLRGWAIMAAHRGCIWQQQLTVSKHWMVTTHRVRESGTLQQLTGVHVTDDSVPHRQQLSRDHTGGWSDHSGGWSDHSGGWSAVASLGWWCCCTTADSTWLVNMHTYYDSSMELKGGHQSRAGWTSSLLIDSNWFPTEATPHYLRHLSPIRLPFTRNIHVDSEARLHSLTFHLYTRHLLVILSRNVNMLGLKPTQRVTT